MRIHSTFARALNSCRFCAAVFTWALVAAALGLVLGFLFGVLCGAFDAVLHGTLDGFSAHWARFSLAGAAAGALLGAFSRICDGHNPLAHPAQRPQLHGELDPSGWKVGCYCSASLAAEARGASTAKNRIQPEYFSKATPRRRQT
jgi:hypothetical protein